MHPNQVTQIVGRLDAVIRELRLKDAVAPEGDGPRLWAHSAFSPNESLRIWAVEQAIKAGYSGHEEITAAGDIFNFVSEKTG